MVIPIQYRNTFFELAFSSFFTLVVPVSVEFYDLSTTPLPNCLRLKEPQKNYTCAHSFSCARKKRTQILIMKVLSFLLISLPVTAASSIRGGLFSSLLERRAQSSSMSSSSSSSMSSSGSSSSVSLCL